MAAWSAVPGSHQFMLNQIRKSTRGCLSGASEVGVERVRNEYKWWWLRTAAGGRSYMSIHRINPAELPSPPDRRRRTLLHRDFISACCTGRGLPLLAVLHIDHHDQDACRESSMPSDQSTWIVAIPQDGDSEGTLQELHSKLAAQSKTAPSLSPLAIPSFKVRTLHPSSHAAADVRRKDRDT